MGRYKELGKRLKAARLARKGRRGHLTQRELAEQLGCEPQRIILWEKGAHKPNTYYRARLTDLLGVTDFSKDEDVMTPEEAAADEATEREWESQ